MGVWEGVTILRRAKIWRKRVSAPSSSLRTRLRVEGKRLQVGGSPVCRAQVCLDVRAKRAQE